MASVSNAVLTDSSEAGCCMKKSNAKKRGPKPDVLVIEGMKWDDAIRKSFAKEKPPEGWPKPEKEEKRLR